MSKSIFKDEFADRFRYTGGPPRTHSLGNVYVDQYLSTTYIFNHNNDVFRINIISLLYSLDSVIYIFARCFVCICFRFGGSIVVKGFHRAAQQYRTLLPSIEFPPSALRTSTVAFPGICFMGWKLISYILLHYIKKENAHLTTKLVLTACDVVNDFEFSLIMMEIKSVVQPRILYYLIDQVGVKEFLKLWWGEVVTLSTPPPETHYIYIYIYQCF